MQQIVALLGEVHQLNKPVLSIECAESNQMIDDENQLCGRKRERGDL